MLNNVKTHDVRRQLFLGITKRMKSSSKSQKQRTEETSSPSESQPQLLHPSVSHEVGTSPRSKRISQHLLVPTTSFTPVSNSSSTLAHSTESLQLSSFAKINDTKPAAQPSTVPVTKFVLHKKANIEDYDYTTFSSNHRLRTSKIKALEQAEVTTSLFFNFELNDGIEELLNEEDSDDVLICLPGLDKQSTRMAINLYQHKFEKQRSKADF